MIVTVQRRHGRGRGRFWRLIFRYQPEITTRAALHLPLYAILGMPQDATMEEIHSSFVQIARVHHPDAGGDVEFYRNAKHAHDVLMKETKRRIYDDTGLDPDDIANEAVIKAIGLVRKVVAEIIGKDDPFATDLLWQIRIAINSHGNDLLQAEKSTAVELDRLQAIQGAVERMWRGAGPMKQGVFSYLAEEIARVEGELVNIKLDLDEHRLAAQMLQQARWVW